MTKNLSLELNKVKRNLLIDYSEFRSHLPNVDLVIYHSKSCKVLAAIPSKITLRERIAQTGYWKIKLSDDELTKRMKVDEMLCIHVLKSPKVCSVTGYDLNMCPDEA